MLRDRAFYALTGIWDSASFKPLHFPPDSRLKEAQRRLLRLGASGITAAGQDVYHIEVPADVDQRLILWLRDNGRQPERPLIAICPGAKTRACIWPIENFLKLGQKLLAEGCEILLLGGPEHSQDARRLVSAWRSGIDGVGKFSVFETASALKQCAFMIGVDTGTTHLAAAVGTRCLALFSQRELSPRWEPMGEGHKVLRYAVPCQNCWLEACNRPGHPCMTGITIEAVFQEAQEMLQATAGNDNNLRGLIFIKRPERQGSLS